MITPVNNPPAPVLESIAVAIPKEEDCEALKLKFDVKTRKHGKGANTAGDVRKGDKGLESHHILQDKAMKGLVSKYSGHAVLLVGLAGGEHDLINASQIARNCPGPGPATFGELQEAAREDLVKGLKGNRKDANGKPMTKKQAEKLADCLVVEAVKKTQENRKKKKKPYLKKSSKVKPVAGCLAEGTLIWLDDETRVPVETLREGVLVEGARGRRTVVRADRCLTPMLEVRLGTEVVVLAPFHRLRLADGRYMRADDLRVGHRVDTAAGPLGVRGLAAGAELRPACSFGVGGRDACRVGTSGVWIELPDTGPPIVAEVYLDRAAAEGG